MNLDIDSEELRNMPKSVRQQYYEDCGAALKRHDIDAEALRQRYLEERRAAVRRALAASAVERRDATL